MTTITEYSQELADEIIERLATGERLRRIEKTINVSHFTVYRWLREHPSFASRYDKVKHPPRKAGFVDGPHYEEVKAEIVRRYRTCGSIEYLCTDDDMPSSESVCNWRKKDREFDLAMQEAFADFADATVGDIMVDANNCNDPAMVPVIKMRNDARLRLVPIISKRYASRMELTGADGGPIQNKTTLDLSKLSDQDLAKLEHIVGVASEPGPDQGGEGEEAEE